MELITSIFRVVRISELGTTDLRWADKAFRGRQVKGVSTAHPDKSAAAEHSMDQGHRIQFHSPSILAIYSRYVDRMLREAIEI
jgi:hypothetical protein